MRIWGAIWLVGSSDIICENGQIILKKFKKRSHHTDRQLLRRSSTPRSLLIRDGMGPYLGGWYVGLTGVGPLILSVERNVVVWAVTSLALI